jgi:hypothetical protein
MQRLVICGFILGMFVQAGTAAAADPALKCQSGKNREAGKYASCRQKAESNLVKTGNKDSYNYAIEGCEDRFLTKWQRLEAQAAAVPAECPDHIADPNTMAAFIAAHCDTVATVLAGGGELPECGDGLINAAGEQCDGTELGGESCQSLGFVDGTLGCDGSCQFDTSGCECRTATGDAALFDVREGKTFSNAEGTGLTGMLTYCGDDVLNGEEQCDRLAFDPALTCGGGCLSDCLCRFVDNMDGTITDNRTKLVWEKKTNLNGYPDPNNVHDADNTYTWANFEPPPEGTAFTSFLARLNDAGGGSCPTGGPTGGCCPNDTCTDVDCFAGHCDWRLPTLVELKTILLEPYPCGTSPCIAPVFGPTVSSTYWSATTFAGDAYGGWVVYFDTGSTGEGSKAVENHVRAVRSGVLPDD